MENEKTKLVKQCEEHNLVLQQREASQEGTVLHRATVPTTQSHAGEMAYQRLVFKKEKSDYWPLKKPMCNMTSSLSLL